VIDAERARVCDGSRGDRSPARIHSGALLYLATVARQLSRFYLSLVWGESLGRGNPPPAPMDAALSHESNSGDEAWDRRATTLEASSHLDNDSGVGPAPAAGA
jgi:hypothetical protein